MQTPANGQGRAERPQPFLLFQYVMRTLYWCINCKLCATEYKMDKMHHIQTKADMVTEKRNLWTTRRTLSVSNAVDISCMAGVL